MEMGVKSEWRLCVEESGADFYLRRPMVQKLGCVARSS